MCSMGHQTMKTLKTKPLTGDPLIDKHLIAGTDPATRFYEIDDFEYTLIYMLRKYHSDKFLEIVEEYYGLQNLIEHPESCVRRNVAQAGYGHEILMYDTDPMVRAVIARTGYKPEYFARDTHYIVRLQVARLGLCFDILKNDDTPAIQQVIKEYQNNER